MEQGTATGWGDLLPVPRPAEASAQDGGPGTLGAGAPATAAQPPRSWSWPFPGCGLASSSLLAADKLIAAAPAGRMRAFTCGACVIALAFSVTLRASQSRVFATSWPGAG